VLVSFSAAFGLGVLTPGHFGPEDDAACAQDAARSVHSRVQFESVHPTAAGAHCPFCHWQRLVGGSGLVAISSVHAVLEPIDRVLTSSARVPRPADLDPHFSRGPPRV
jgi:hypothetical protein